MRSFPYCYYLSANNNCIVYLFTFLHIEVNQPIILEHPFLLFYYFSFRFDLLTFLAPHVDLTVYESYISFYVGNDN